MTSRPPPTDSGSSAPGVPGPGGPPGSFPAFVVRRGDQSVDAGVEQIGLGDLPDGEVLIEVDWSAVNYKDGMVTRPGNRVARISPLVPGVDLVGTVVDSTDPTVERGSQVIVHGYDLGVAHHGGFSQFARVPAGWVVPLPAGLSARHAAVIGTAGFTAALSVLRLERHGLVPGDGPVLVTGASGGVGSMAVSLLAARGYEVVASTGRQAERPYLIGLGASEVVGRDDLDDKSGRALAPERWSGAVDCVGGTTLASVLRSLRYGAAVAASGLTGGTVLETSVFPFIVRNASLIGVDSVMTEIGERRSVWTRIASDFPLERLDGIVEAEVTLDGLPPVLEAILAGEVRGRMLVRPGR